MSTNTQSSSLNTNDFNNKPVSGIQASTPEVSPEKVVQTTPTTVDMTHVDGDASTATPVGTTQSVIPGSSFDSIKYEKEISTNLSNQLARVNEKGRPSEYKIYSDGTNEDSGVEFYLGNVPKASQEELTFAFKRSIQRYTKANTEFRLSQQLFTQLNNEQYVYTHTPLGRMRTAIDENGNKIGLPELVDDSGNPIDLTTPNNLHDYNYTIA